MALVLASCYEIRQVAAPCNAALGEVCNTHYTDVVDCEMKQKATGAAVINISTIYISTR